ncbi:RNA-directed DNA polymerase from mobile element jockey [Caerostris extrusa]|uniref:RNA-directed DNA polymerase from mobile element jockey n=1 Tax=Caerostris extrusa TaxID=172846 RepID=A0AAV4MDE1_CAEEX|nr:RNA-directed DNA polymerase from mobile element jockey [Caerostris extrusa]
MLSGSTSPSDNQDLSTNQQTQEIATNSSDLLAPLAVLKEFAVITKALPKLMETPPRLKTSPICQTKINFTCPTFDCFRNDRNNPLYFTASVNTAIFIKNHLPYHHIPTLPLQHIEATIISLNISNMDPIIIAFIYVPETSDPQLFTLDLQKSIKTSEKPSKDYSDKLWKEKLEDLQTDDGSFWNLTKNFKSSVTKISHLNSTISTAVKDLYKAEPIAQKLEKQFQLTPISDPVHDNTVMQTIKHFYQNNSDDIIPPVSPSDITIIIKHTKIKSALGLDSISTKILKKLPNITIIKRCYLINKVLELKYFPDSWKTATIIPILKTRKRSYEPRKLSSSISSFKAKHNYRIYHPKWT